MQKKLHVLSKAASIGILSVILRVHRQCWSPSLCRAFGSINLSQKGQLKHRDLVFFSSSPTSLAYSKAAAYSNNSFQVKKMASQPTQASGTLDHGRNCTTVTNHTKKIDRYRSLPHSNELSRFLLEAIALCDNVEKTRILSTQTLYDACHILHTFIQSPSTNTESNSFSETDYDRYGSSPHGVINVSTSDESHLLPILCSYASSTAEILCRVADGTKNDKNETNRKSKKRSWEALQNAAGILQSTPSTSTTTSLETGVNNSSLQLEPNGLAVCIVFGALSLLQQQYQCGKHDRGGAKAAASALSSTLSRNNILRHRGRAISSLLLQCYTDHAFRNKKMCSYFDLNILNHLARSFQLTEESVEPRVIAAIVRRTVRMTEADDKKEDVLKQEISGAFSLACQIRPWSILSPVELIEVATTYDFFYSAEEICRSAHKAAKESEKLSPPMLDENITSISKDYRIQQYSASKQMENSKSAVELLIDTAIKNRMFRRADAMATSLYHLGGQSRYAEARYLHARDTIAKVISKRQFPIVDRQIERVDKALSKVKNENINGFENDPGVEIRKYAIQKFEEVGEIAAAQRLASIFNIDYVYDENAALIATSLRREKYLQYDDVLPGDIPSLITKPGDLISEFDRLLREDDQDLVASNKKSEKLIGFDAEWDEETQGVALLQLASMKTVLLIDILALSSGVEGVKALRQTVGKLLANPDWIMIGFACHQDLSRLRASPCVNIQQELGQQEQHWMSTTSAILDVQPLVGTAEESLRKTGLSRACEHFLGKPLDKAEQCSLWSARPLSERQRSYASLDAWVCVGIYKALLLNENE